MPTVTIDVYQTQEAFIFDENHFAAFIGGRGAGKTVSGAIKAMPYLTKPGMGIVAAPTYTMLQGRALAYGPRHLEAADRDINRADMRMVTHAGHEVLFRSADDPNKLRGPSASWAWIDEACMCPSDTWPVLLGVLREGGRMGQCWVTSTPRGFDWVFDVFGQGAPDTALYKARMDGNPFLDDAFKSAMRTQYASEFARQELDAEFITLGAGLIKRVWFEVVPKAPAGLRWHRFWDLAASSKTNADYTASLRAALHDDTIYLDGLIRGQWEWPETRQIILQTMQAEPDTVQVGLENVAFQLAAVQEIQRSPRGYAHGRTWHWR